MDTFNTIKKLVIDLLHKIKPVERALSVGRIGTAVERLLWNLDDGWASLLDIYMDAGTMYALANFNGELARAEIFIGTDEAVTIGELEKVVAEFRPIDDEVERVFRTFRTQDEQTRWISVSAVAVVNRSGEIDSRALFDSLIANAEKYDAWPERQVHHMGAQFRTGQVDFMARDGYALITSGIYDDSDLARAEIKARSEEPEAWGDSIHFYPLQKPDIIEVVRSGTRIPVYTNGIMIEVSTLPEKLAASWFTNSTVLENDSDTEEINRMAISKAQQETLNKLLGSDKKVTEFLDDVEDLNRSVEEGDAVARDTEENEDDATEAAEATEVEVDDELLEQIADHIMGTDAMRAVLALPDQLEEMQDSFNNVMRQLGELAAAPAEEEPADEPKAEDVARAKKLVLRRPREEQKNNSVTPIVDMATEMADKLEAQQ